MQSAKKLGQQAREQFKAGDRKAFQATVKAMNEATVDSKRRRKAGKLWG